MPQSNAHLTPAQQQRQQRRRMSLGAAIKTLREQRGLTQSQLAAAVGVSTRGVIRIEKGVTSLTVDVLGRYADALNVRPSELLRLSEVWSEVDPKP